MLSRIYEDDVKEEVKSYNRQRNDNNYIEKAIDFNQQQERQKNQNFIKPNLMNQTARTDANTNTDYAPNSANQTAITDENYNTVYTPNLINQTARTEANNTSYEPDNMYQTAKFDANTNTNDDSVQSGDLNQSIKSVTFTPMKKQAVASTPMKEQAASISSKTPSPISRNFSIFLDANGNLICNFCRKVFPSRKKLRRHLDMEHFQDMSLLDQEKLVPLSEEPEDEDPKFEGSGAKPKQRKLIKPAVFDPFNIDEPDVTTPEQNLPSKANNKSNVILPEQDLSAKTTNKPKKKKTPQRQSYNSDTIKPMKDDMSDFVSEHKKETYLTRKGRPATRLVKK